MNTIRATKLALALLLAASPAALAASTTDSQQPQQPQADYNQVQPQTGEQPATGDTSETGQQNSGNQDTTAESKQSQQAEIPGQIVLQSKDTILASSLIGASVLAPDNEDVGNVNDVIVGLDGTITGLVIGVGGFLGIGEKDVALEMSAFTTKVSPDGGSVQLYLNATREDLDNAPSFKTAYQQKQEEDAVKSQQEMQNQMQNNGTQVPKLPDAQSAPQPQQ